MHASEIWEGRGVVPALARIALVPLSILYAVGWECYLAIYRLGLKRASRPHRPILCVGNLISGGSGKTPVALYLVELLGQMGHRVVVSCSGYGSPHSEAASLAPNGPIVAAEWGDEAALFRFKQPDVPLIVGRRRVLAARICQDSFPEAVLLLDDGFQHLPLRKDLAIVLDPPRAANPWCLPAGPYREPRWNRARADLLIPDHFQVRESSDGLLAETGERVDNPLEAHLLCAVGQPKNVLRSLESVGVKVLSRKFMPDHDPLTGGTLFSEMPGPAPIVVTAKDWVKLKDRSDIATRTFLILDHQVRIEPEEEFKSWLKDKLDAIQKANLSR
jgi:tetraacyldisaccharide 4'-kinase